VINCENGGAPLEALKAQAVAARSYLYYKLNNEGEIGDGQSDQVFSCGREPGPLHYEAVAATAGEVLVYRDEVIAAFYVAGASPNAPSCIAQAGDPDPYNTETYVTYNEGRRGDQVEQSTLGWVNPGNIYNRGCKSQNGAACLARAGREYRSILRFYYGEDIIIERASGACVDLPTPPPPPQMADQMQPLPMRDQAQPPPVELDQGPRSNDQSPVDRPSEDGTVTHPDPHGDGGLSCTVGENGLQLSGRSPCLEISCSDGASVAAATPLQLNARTLRACQLSWQLEVEEGGLFELNSFTAEDDPAAGRGRLHFSLQSMNREAAFSFSRTPGRWSEGVDIELPRETPLSLRLDAVEPESGLSLEAIRIAPLLSPPLGERPPLQGEEDLGVDGDERETSAGCAAAIQAVQSSPLNGLLPLLLLLLWRAGLARVTEESTLGGKG
ncbi:MAG: SpoIID/LytB domain-containing protein, partial [Myxococcota bacterium]|nr:SpoIID/LytB domain-containing protein [Myxococcota bacterium]